MASQIVRAYRNAFMYATNSCNFIDQTCNYGFNIKVIVHITSYCLLFLDYIILRGTHGADKSITSAFTCCETVSSNELLINK